MPRSLRRGDAGRRTPKFIRKSNYFDCQDTEPELAFSSCLSISEYGGIVASVNITPSPRVLRMLGQIDFAPWQCLAELIDNSIDAFIDQVSSGTASASPRIYIKLPTENDLRNGTGVISIRDTASGMTLGSLENAVRAGYSGNDPLEKMGLFGMGFNISTARMGRRTEVWTATADDTEWTGLVIDFDTLERQKSFDAPLEKREKTPSELDQRAHGTEIRISRLEADRVRPLVKGMGKKRTKDRLGKIYGRVMSRLGVEILYDGDVIKPWQHCAWDISRSVETQSFGNVPARIDIDKTLDPRRFCTTCWVWLLPEDDDCSACGHSDNVVTRQRRLRGWLGVQRYFDKEHYGIDLVRNGRVIEELDKSFFTFTDENGESIFEYPIDAIHWGGRLIGELEIDFVRVSHQKDSFDKLDPEWRQVVELVRGKAPLQPKIAERMGLGRNDSPLARLFTGYRKGTAGLKDLVPGTIDGKGLNSGPVQEYVTRFYEGDPDYQSDEKWFELVKQAERGKRGESGGATEAGGEFPIDDEPSTGGDGETGGATTAAVDEAGPSPTPTRAEPELDDELSGNYEVDELPGDVVIKVAAYRHKSDIDGEPFTIKPEGYAFRFDYNALSPFFEESLDGPASFMMIDLAQHFLSLSAETPRRFPVSLIARHLEQRYFPGEAADLEAAAAACSSLVDELRRWIDERLPDVGGVDPTIVPSSEKTRISRAAAKAIGASDAEASSMIAAGTFARFASTPFLIELVRVYPQIVMDGGFFDRPYETLSQDDQPVILGEVLDSLQDVVWLSDEGASAVSKDTGWRLRYARALSSLRLLQFWRA